jgi:topoisomerase-4 subunit B
MTTPKTQQYTEASIKILEGLEPVKQRPGMYTRTVNPLHIVQEIIDNGVDEAIGGFAKTLKVELLPAGEVRVTDDGRGIPVGLHPEKQIPVVQAVFTILHAGGKFDKQNGGAYAFSGGLHGVGVSVTNALSDVLDITVHRDGWEHTIGFANGDVAKPLKKVGRTELNGTSVLVRPNPKYFDSPDLPIAELRVLLRSKAVLLPGYAVTLVDAREPDAVPKEETFLYENGMVTLLGELSGEEPIVPVFEGQAYAGAEDESFSEGEGCAYAFSWFEHGDGTGSSFVNLIPTPLGGTHIAGLRSALYTALRSFIDHHAMLPKGVKLGADDVFKNVRYVLSGRLLDPQFDNQTKDRLSSRDGVKLVEKMLQPRVEAWLNMNPTQARLLADLAIRQAMARQRASNKPERKRSSSVVMLPGKLAECESTDPTETELFLVEGDSAGGSAKQGRNKDNQAILPMRGKGLNVWEKDRNQALANEEIYDIALAIGVQPHTLADEVDFSKLRYYKICILADADVDGFHIQVLLLTLFFKHFPQLIERGHIYVARPPLYRLDVESAGKKRAAKKLYVMDAHEQAMWEDRLTKEGYVKWATSRFKGLGEMEALELWDTTLNPDTRRLLKVMLPDAARNDAKTMFDNLMSKGQSSWRREWMERRGNEVEA